MTEAIVDFEAYREQLVEKLESVREFRSAEAVDGDGDELTARAAEVLRTSVHEVGSASRPRSQTAGPRDRRPER